MSKQSVHNCSWTQVLEQATVQGQGTFTAYRDGRVRMLFDDRAILHMNTTHSHCKVDGWTDATKPLIRHNGARVLCHACR